MFVFLILEDAFNDNIDFNVFYFYFYNVINIFFYYIVIKI